MLTTLRAQLAFNKERAAALERELEAQLQREKVTQRQLGELSLKKDGGGGTAAEIAEVEARWAAKLERSLARERRGAEQMRADLLAAVATSAAKAAAADHFEALQRQAATHRESCGGDSCLSVAGRTQSQCGALAER